MVISVQAVHDELGKELAEGSIYLTATPPQDTAETPAPGPAGHNAAGPASAAAALDALAMAAANAAADGML